MMMVSRGRVTNRVEKGCRVHTTRRVTGKAEREKESGSGKRLYCAFRGGR